MLKTLFIAMLFPVFANASIASFQTDGCSSVAPDRLEEFEWKECCILHDLAYWAGGGQQARLFADKQLKQCLSEKAKTKKVSANYFYSLLDDLYYFGVRIGGAPYWKTSYRWGFGHGYMGDYSELTHHDLMALVDSMLSNPYIEVLHPIRTSAQTIEKQYLNISLCQLDEDLCAKIYTLHVTPHGFFIFD